MGQTQVRAESEYLDAEEDLSPSQRRQQREEEREGRRKRKAERDGKKMQRLTNKYSAKMGTVDVELANNRSRTRSESLESASDPPTRLERYFGETAGSDDSRRISWSFVSLMFSVAFWNGVLDLAMFALQRVCPVSYEDYFFVVLIVLRVLYGLISDSCPRQRRKPYLLASGSGGFIILVVAALVQIDSPAGVLVIFFTLWALAGWAEVMTDALVVERSIGKDVVVVWRLQAKLWLMRAAGATLSFFGREWLLDSSSPQIIFGCLSLFPGLVVLSAYFLIDTPITNPTCGGPKGFGREFVGLGRAMLKKSPFFSFFLLLSVTAMPSVGVVDLFVERQLNFLPASFDYLQGSTWAVCVLVVLCYPAFLQKKSPRSTFFFTSLIIVFIGLLPLIFLTNAHIQIGVPDFVVVFGSAILLRVFTAVQYLALRVMCVQFVPTGVEASFFATLTSTFSLSALGGRGLGSLLAEALGVGCSPQCDFSNLSTLFLLCQLSPLVPLALFGLIFRRIRGKDDYVCACLPWAKAGAVVTSPRSGERKVYLLSSSSRATRNPDDIVPLEVR